MAFQQGQSGNPAGRPQGAKNKTSMEIRKILLGILERNTEQFEADLMALEPKDRVNVVLKLSVLVLPKLKEDDDYNNDLWGF